MRGFLLALVLAAAAAAVCAQETAPGLPGGGLFFDVIPVIREGHIVAPVRPLIEWARGRVVYDQGRVLAYEEGATNPRIELLVGSKEARLSGSAYTLEVPAEVIGGRVCGPLKFVAESFGVWVEPEGRVVTLRVPQLNRELQLAIPPDPSTHQDKIWKLLAVRYGLPQPTPPDVVALTHWNLFSMERKRELMAEIGSDAPTIIESHWGGRAVAGLRVLADAVDENAGAASVQVMVKYADDGVYEESYNLVLEPNGWKIRKESSAQME